jgi:hypothetical protein
MRFNGTRWLRGIFWGLLAVFFWVFHVQVVKVHFGSDEMMNLYRYWQPPLWKTIAAHFAFWMDLVRPMGAAYYLPVYRLFGLNPYPFSVVRTALLFINTILFFFLANRLTRSWWIAMLAAFPIAYQSTLGNLHYDGAFIYDVLCGGFYFAAFLYYLQRRKHNARLGPRETCIFLVLYICALDSKEMAVSLPVLVLAYEFLFKGRRAQIRPGLIAAAVTVLFIVSKTFGPAALTSIEAYRPSYTWGRFSDSNTRFMNELFYTDIFTPGRVLMLWAVLLYVGLRNWSLRKFDPRWLFLWIWVVVTPLPLAFLPGRGAATLYIVCAGWALLAALVIRAVLRSFARQPVAGLPRRAIMTAGLAACIAAYWHETRRADDKVVYWYLKNGEDTQQAIAGLQALAAHPASHSFVVFLNDPFPSGYDTLFIASLIWNDPTIRINLQNRYRLPASELDKGTHIYDFVEGRFVVTRASAQIH